MRERLAAFGLWWAAISAAPVAAFAVSTLTAPPLAFVAAWGAVAAALTAWAAIDGGDDE